MSDQSRILDAIQEEQHCQDELLGPDNHSPDDWLHILNVKVGNAGDAILHRDNQQYADELIQCAAVCVAALESAVRNQGVHIP